MKSNSSKGFKNILDSFSENLAALENLGFLVKPWCLVLSNTLLLKLDNSSPTDLERKYSDKNIPTFQGFFGKTM